MSVEAFSFHGCITLSYIGSGKIHFVYNLYIQRNQFSFTSINTFRLFWLSGNVSSDLECYVM